MSMGALVLGTLLQVGGWVPEPFDTGPCEV